MVRAIDEYNARWFGPENNKRHHIGSSSSKPKGANSWIEAIRKVHNLDRNPQCAAVNTDHKRCPNTATIGAHIKKGAFHEWLKNMPGGKSKGGLGGTPVVPVCSDHHPTRGKHYVGFAKVQSITDHAAEEDQN
ncbi:hypothetical protein DUNSADRAFT_18192 [Dunaliella salina]|uniref:Uncharacterized protein n=1 Tax=Dunaliella salina TaxID=3046 RepID=A0ABQ7G0K9_DUNSA|nr:hypothetical protein DUNSADRAFT_18192 [Dunaliella salina]|eukprot:KAF5828110.1 hypothetical protein DUNSADRAFT_18192 [Dunaliella salina]